MFREYLLTKLTILNLQQIYNLSCQAYGGAVVQSDLIKGQVWKSHGYLSRGAAKTERPDSDMWWP